MILNIYAQDLRYTLSSKTAMITLIRPTRITYDLIVVYIVDMLCVVFRSALQLDAAITP